MPAKARSVFFVPSYRCNGKPAHPEVAPEVTGEVSRLTNALADQSLGRTEIQALLRLKGRANFRDRYLLPALAVGVLEMTIPDKPNSRLQKYRLTAASKRLAARPPSP